jgi:hypothetical protein
VRQAILGTASELFLRIYRRPLPVAMKLSWGMRRSKNRLKSALGGCCAFVGKQGRTKPGGRGMSAGAGDRRLRSDGSQPSKLEGIEVITCPPLGLGTGKNRDIAGTIIIEVLNAPFSGAVAVFDDGDILLKRVVHQHVLESLSGSKSLPLGWTLGGYDFPETSRLVRHCCALSRLASAPRFWNWAAAAK